MLIWQKTIGGNCGDIMTSISSTTDGGYIVGGMSCSGISGEKTEDAREFSYDYWLLKLNALGDIVWQKTYGGSGIDNLTKVKQTADGGFIAIGNSSSNASYDKTENSRGDYDFWILRLNPQGDIVWQKTIGGSNQDIPEDVTELDDQAFVIAGWSSSDSSGEKAENSRGAEDFWIVHIDAEGNIINQRTIGGNQFDQVKSIAAMPDGFLVAGTSYSLISGEKSENNCGMADSWILKLNYALQIVWQKTIGGDLADSIADVELTDSGIFLGSNSRSDSSCEKSEISRGGSDFWVVKLAPDELGIPQIDLSQISIAPNPTDGNVNLTFQNAFSGSIAVIDQTGKLIKRNDFNDKFGISIFIPSPSGVYFLKLNNGSKSMVFKIIKR